MNMDSKNNLRDKLKESTREAILAAAVAVIISDTGEIRMEDIAEKAGVAIGTIYNYFDNRQTLIDTIIERRRTMAETNIRRVLEQTEGQHICARLENLFQTLVSFLERHKTVTHHALQIKETNANKNGKKSLMGMLNDYVLEMLQTALERKEIRPEYMDVYPLVILGYLRGIFAQVDAGVEDGYKPGFAQKLAELFLSGAGESAEKT
jgi:AcrR family transcriptional regulator